MYKCVVCGKELTLEQIQMPYGVKCPFCNNRIFKKTRTQLPKKVKAE
jgi:DNA-directed RNA polymerase subunit RPC12/RpoP